MQQLALKKRPTRYPVLSSTLWLAFVSLVIIALGAGTSIADPRHYIDLFIYASIALGVWAATAAGLYLDRDYNRSLPDILERYLNSNLDQKDYEQLHHAALRHPAIRPWISGCIKNGEITYRDAEPLFARINQHIEEHPDTPRQPHASLSSQQKLLQLLQARSLARTYTHETSVFVTARSDTSGSLRISIHHTGDHERPPIF